MRRGFICSAVLVSGVVLYSRERNDFRFVHCNEPIMDAEHTCLINTRGITYMMPEAIRDLMEPIRFGQDMARRGESCGGNRRNLESSPYLPLPKGITKKSV